MIKAPPAPAEKVVIRKHHIPHVVIPVPVKERPASPAIKGVSFYHSGDLGDIIFSLPVIRAFGGGTLILGPNSGSHPYQTRERMTESRANSILPLLRIQPYLDNAFFSPSQPRVNYDLNQFRTLLSPSKPHDNLCHLHLQYFGLSDRESDKAWLRVDRAVKIQGHPVVISRTLRHQGQMDWHRVIQKYGDQIVFLGLPDEHADFCRRFGDVAYHTTKDLLEAARIIAGCDLFISNACGLHAVAEGLKVNLIQDAKPDSHQAVFVRPGAAYELPDKKTLSIYFQSPADGFSGIGQAAGQLVLGLKNRGHSITFSPTRESEMYGRLDPRLNVLRGTFYKDSMRVVFETTGFIQRSMKPGDVVISLWETDVWPPVDVAALNVARLVIVTCQWNSESLAKCGCSAPIRTIPLGVDTSIFHPSGTYPKICTFAAAGRVAGAGGRKGIDMVVKAFLEAFPRQQDVRLRIKAFPECEITDLAKDSRIDINRSHLTREDVAKWHQGNTAFISASFGEGWGLCLHEAMACGSAPVACRFGGQAEFFDSTVGYEIPFRLEPARGGSTYEGLGNWAVPDFDSIVSAMRRIYVHQDEAAMYAAYASDRARYFSWEHAVECLEKELLAL